MCFLKRPGVLTSTSFSHTGMGDQIKEMMKNSRDSGDAAEISSETLLKHADKVNEEIDNFAENPPGFRTGF